MDEEISQVTKDVIRGGVMVEARYSTGKNALKPLRLQIRQKMR
jgi:hypothetical protein